MSNAKIEKIKTANSEGEEGLLAIKDYEKHILKELKVTDLEIPEAGVVSAANVVKSTVKAVIAGQDVDENVKAAFPEMLARIEQDVKLTRESSLSAAEQATKKKEEAEAAKKKKEEEEAKAAELKLAGQTELAVGFKQGADVAAGEFVQELESLKGALPEGITVKSSGSGLGLEIGPNVSKKDLGVTLGYLEQKNTNNSFIGNTIYFFIGDLINVGVERGIFTTAKEGGVFIAEYMEKEHGKKMNLANIDNCKRMAERTPVELRNPKVDYTAYLAVSNMKTPKKSEGEKDEDFKKRLAKFESDRTDLQSKLAGEVITKRIDVLDPVNEVLYSHGLKERPPEEKPITLQQHILAFIHSTVGINELVGVHKDHPSAAVYKDGENLLPLPQEELEKVRDDAYAHILNALYSTKDGKTIKDFSRGYVEVTAKVKIGEDADKNPIMEDKKTKNYVYPNPFWEVKKEEESPAASEATTEAAPTEEVAANV